MTDKERIAHLEGELNKALARISELEAIILRLSTGKTSKNSHNPPSHDKWGKNQSLRQKSDKSVGGQKGHKGGNLKMTGTPDVTEKIYPQYCNNCG
jgi:transposase